MSIARHQKVKQLFLGALEQTSSSRIAYISRECGADAGLRRDVEALLAAHRESTVLFAGLRPAAKLPTQNSVERFSSLFDLLGFLFKSPGRRLLAVAITIGAVVLLGYWTRMHARNMLLTQAGSALRAFIDSNSTELLTAERRWKSEVAALVEFPALNRPLGNLISTRSPAAWHAFASTIQPLLSGRSYRSYFVMTASGDLVATSAGLREGHATPSGMAVLGRMRSRDGSVEFPSPGSDFGEPSDQGNVWPRIVVVSPIRQADRSITGALGVVLPFEEISERLLNGRPFRTGETYLFRENGVMLSPSRFASDLERWKLIDPAEVPRRPLSVRDPGRSLYESNGLRPGEDPDVWPLTEVVRVATANPRGRSSPEATGVILEPYRDYRGEWVVGAWRWSNDLRVGLTAEVDEAEILSTLRYIDFPIGLIVLLLFGAGVWTVVSSWLLSRLRFMTLAREALGQYTLTEKIGEGGMGEVFLAQHAQLRRPAAVKILRPDRLSEASLRNFEREAQAASRLRHPNTVAIYDFGQTRNGLPYYVMEYVPGVDLGQWVNTNGAMSPARAIHVAKQICAALAEAHSQKVIHRDIKPANVMLCELAGQHDFVKILDFGLAKDTSVAGNDTTYLARFGTPFYTSPERLLPQGVVDHRCDIYSLGVLLYFLVCATTPYEAGAGWIESALSGTPVPPSQRASVPLSLERIILECMSREPADRPGSAMEVLHRLEQIDDVAVWHAADYQETSLDSK